MTAVLHVFIYGGRLLTIMYQRLENLVDRTLLFFFYRNQYRLPLWCTSVRFFDWLVHLRYFSSVQRSYSVYVSHSLVRKNYDSRAPSLSDVW